MWADVTLEVDAGAATDLEVTDGAGVEFGTDEHLRVAYTELPDYDGPYEVVPASDAITLPTSARALWRDVTIAPIPSNYGLITYSGGVLTVS